MFVFPFVFRHSEDARPLFFQRRFFFLPAGDESLYAGSWVLPVIVAERAPFLGRGFGKLFLYLADCFHFLILRFGREVVPV